MICKINFLMTKKDINKHNLITESSDGDSQSLKDIFKLMLKNIIIKI
jgi:hypothetical protein